jgi:DNA repair exonuclease SbcCD ATPase subunit
MSDDQKQISASDELALDALSQASQSSEKLETDEELKESNELAETLTSLQNLIEKHARELTRIEGELKEKRQSLKNVFDNDIQLTEAREEVEKHTQAMKERKVQLQNDPQSTSLKIDVAELNQQKKELEETLSNHLVNYHALTNSTSFDTSDGDQWDFSIKAKIKAKKL